MWIERARRSPFKGVKLDDVPPHGPNREWRIKMKGDGYTSAVVDSKGIIMRLYRGDPNAISAMVGAELMNDEAALSLMAHGTKAEQHVETY